jgi:HK97 family phage portal protein
MRLPSGFPRKAPRGGPSLSALAARGLAALKEFGVTATGNYGWTVRSGRWHSAFYPGSEVDWAKEAGTVWHNGAAGLCVNYLFNKVAEPKARVMAPAEGGKEAPVVGHPLLALLAAPNPEYRGSSLLRAAALSYKVAGNAYVIKVRDAGGLGRPRELWYVPHWQMEPVPPEDNGPTQFYRHVVGNRERIYARRDVIHLTYGRDPENPRKGLNPFRAQYQSLVADREVDTYTVTVLRNLGVIGALVSPAGDEEISPDQADTLKQMITDQTSGDMRASVIVPSLKVNVQKVGATPQEMSLSTMGDRPETRVCAVFGFEPMAVGLPSGNTTYANKAEAREASYENGIVPMLTEFAEALTADLLPEMDPAPGRRVDFCYDAVRDLMPDLNDRDRRARDNFTRGIWKLSRAQTETGQQADPDVDGYAWQLLPPKAAQAAAGAPDPPAPADS